MHKKIRGMLIASWIFASKIPYGKTLKLYHLLPIYREGEWQYSLEELHNL
jgi:hypothetical protein